MTEKTVWQWQTDFAILSLDSSGVISSLKQKGSKNASERELLARFCPFLQVILADNSRIDPLEMQLLDDKQLRVSFPQGHARLELTANEHYFKINVLETQLPEVQSLVFCQFLPALQKYIGEMAGLASDDESGLGLRSLGLTVESSFLTDNSAHFQVWCRREHKLNSGSVAFFAAPRHKLLSILRSISEREDIPISKHGGAWANESTLTRGSYLFADLAAEQTDAWIELARRGGFMNIHLHQWWKTLGHYEPNPVFFPGGLPQLQKTVQRLHAAGLRVGIHTLTGCIEPDDPWVTPVPSPELISLASYTLAQPMQANDTTMYVNEKPVSGHELVWSYSCNGNVFRLGQELIRYHAISSESPYAFEQCERGAFGSAAMAHAAGTQADYLQQRYLAFYPEPDSNLAEELTNRIAHVYNSCQLDMLYFDGSEGMRNRYAIDVMRWKIFRKLHAAVCEGSCLGHNNWWFHSRLGTWDHPVWGSRKFHDEHIKLCLKARKSDLLEPQLGWWAPLGPSEFHRSQFPDELEYFAGKNLALDGAMSIQSVDCSKRPPNARLPEMMTILGWYERLRLARYFDAATLATLSQAGADFQLRIDADGCWRLTPVRLLLHKFTNQAEATEAWQLNNPYKQQALAFRLEALYQLQSSVVSGKQATIDFSQEIDTASRETASGIKMLLACCPGRGADSALQIQAQNSNDTNRAAWCKIGLSFPHPYHNIQPARGFGVWIKGDNSGALLNFQLKTAQAYFGGLSEHYVDLNFSGWRYFELLFRERDAARYNDYQWPGSQRLGRHDIYRTPLNTEHIEQFNLLLNAIPASGQSQICVGPIHLLPEKKVYIRQPELSLNGQKWILPVELLSGQYLELETNGQLSHFDERGSLMNRIKLSEKDQSLILAAGDNHLQLNDTGGKPPRAELTVFCQGNSFGNLNQQIDWKCLQREYDKPIILLQTDGQDNHWKIMAGQSENKQTEIKLELELELDNIGSCLEERTEKQSDLTLDEPILRLNGHDYRFPVSMAIGQLWRCRDKQNWQLLNAAGQVIQTGRLSTPLPTLHPGENPASLTFAKAGSKTCRLLLRVVKNHQ